MPYKPLALALATMLLFNGCGAVIAYDRMRQENDKAALVHQYRLCVESKPQDPTTCDHITAGLASSAVTLHQRSF